MTDHRCMLCNAENGLVAAGFKQNYSQAGREPVQLDWWECRHCKGWFAYPLPTMEMIQRHWPTITYNDSQKAEKTASAKEPLQRRVLDQLSVISERGPLLDIGCNFGHFMEMAREQGWQPIGMEPNDDAAATAQAKGFEVHRDWSVSESSLAKERFNALVAIDVFYYDWHPIRTLETFYQMLNPGGMLIMRLTNKHLILNIQRLVFRDSQQRNTRLSKTLKGQYHSIGMRSLSSVLSGIGFTDVAVHPHATAAPLPELGKATAFSYLAADVMYAVSLGQFNISPGVLLTARKP